MKSVCAFLLAAGLLVASARPATAAPFAFDVLINTTSLIGSPAGPFSLDFQLNGAGTPVANSVFINNFIFGGGSPTGTPNLLGHASGNLSSAVSLDDNGGSFFNEFFQTFTAGSQLGFRVNMTANVTPTPDAFSFAILDSALLNITTTGVGDALGLVSITNPTLLVSSDLKIFKGTSGAAGDFSGVTAGATPVPEPTSMVLLGTGLGTVVTRRLRRQTRRVLFVAPLFLAAALSSAPAAAQPVKKVFVIAMENTNWTQNGLQFLGGQQQIRNNAAAPFLNDLVDGKVTALLVNGVPTNVSAQTAYANRYFNVLAGSGQHIHPSEPNYIWAEGGSNFGVLSDNTPYQSPGGTNQTTTNHLVTLLTSGGKTWKSYQEDIDLVPTSGGVNTPGSNALTSTVAAPSAWTVPLTNFSGTNNTSYTNAYNGAHQYDYGAKHNPMVFFSDTNGGNISTTANAQRLQYAPLQQLATDLANNTVADYTWITPNQFNDMHSGLSAGFTYNGVNYTSNSSATLATGVGGEKIAQGDNFLKMIIPLIMASQAYQDNGAIILWWDESEPDGTTDRDDFTHTVPEIVISKLARPNVNGVPYASNVDFTHSSDLRTMQEIFGVADAFLLDANNAPDLSDLFVPGALAGPFALTKSGYVLDRRTGRYVQQWTLTNTSNTPQAGPFYIVLDDLASNATLATATGVTSTPPTTHPEILIPNSSGGLAPGASISVTLEFADPSATAIAYSYWRVLHGPTVVP